MEKLNVEDLLQKAISKHRAKKYEEAESIYRKILASEPDHPDANHNLGVLAVTFSKFKFAKTYFEKALEVNPRLPQYWMSLIDLNLKLSEFEIANDTIKRVQNSDLPSKIVAPILKKFDFFIKNGFPDTKSKTLPKHYEHLLFSQYKIGKYETVAKDIETLKQYFQNEFNLLSMQGLAYSGIRNYELAVICFMDALELRPTCHATYANMGNAYSNNGDFKNAISSYKKALELNPSFAHVYSYLGNIYRKIGSLDLAIENHEIATKLEPENAVILTNFGIALEEFELLEEALLKYSLAKELDPKNPRIYFNIGRLKKLIGDLPGARCAFTKAIEFHSNYTEAFQSLISITDKDNAHKLIPRMKKVYQNKEIMASERAQISFSLANAYDKLEQYDVAFKFFEDANLNLKKDQNYSYQNEVKFFERIRKLDNRFSEFQIEAPQTDNMQPIPIFVVGMPRSGTTLLEQILSSHSAIAPGGELQQLNRLSLRLLGDIGNVKLSCVEEIRLKYLEKIKDISMGHTYVVDKQPFNFRFLNLIRVAFPEAYVLHSYRMPEAVCWSNFSNYYPDTAMGFTNDFQSLVRYHNAFEDIMLDAYAHSNKKLIRVNYEDLTEDYENQIRSIIEQLGLKFEDACLHPEYNDRLVRTASQQQVRRKIYSGSSQKWRHYQFHIQHYLDELTIKL